MCFNVGSIFSHRQWQKICVTVSKSSKHSRHFIVSSGSLILSKYSSVTCKNKNSYLDIFTNKFKQFLGFAMIRWITLLRMHQIRTTVPTSWSNFWFAQNWIYCLATRWCYVNSRLTRTTLKLLCDVYFLISKNEWVPRLGIDYWLSPMRVFFS